MFLIKSQLDTLNTTLRLHYYDNRHKDEQQVTITSVTRQYQK